MASVLRPLVLTPFFALSPFVAIGAQTDVTSAHLPLVSIVGPPKPAWTQPVPAGPVYPTSLLTWVERPSRALLDTPVVPALRRGPVVTRYVPTSPWAAVGAQSAVGSALPITTLGLVVGAPFHATTAPVPVLGVSRFVAVTAQAGVTGTVNPIHVPIGTPKPASTHPVPRGYPFPITLRTVAERATLALLTAPPPAEVRVRAALITRYAKREDFTAIRAQAAVRGSLLTTTLTPVTVTYQLVSGDWPNPDRPVHPMSLRTWTQSGRLPILASVPAPQVDQPNPRGYAYPTSLLTWLQEPSPGLLYVAPATPSKPLKWPVPAGYPYPVSLRTWTLNLLQTTLKDQDTFLGRGSAYDWPVPRGYVHPITLRTWTQERTIALANAPSLRPLDWPNPRGYAYPTSLRTWTDSLELAILAAPPYRPFDWPNPAPIPPAIDLKTIAQSIPLPLLELLTTTPSLGVNIDLIVTLATDGLELTVCVNKEVALTVTTSLTIELKVP